MVNHTKNYKPLIITILLLQVCAIHAYPQISRLKIDDFYFKQLVSKNTAYYQSSGSILDMSIYSYVPNENDDIFSIAAKCNIPYDTIVSLNAMTGPDQLPEKMLLIAVPGIFVFPEQSNPSPLLKILAQRTDEYKAVKIRDTDLKLHTAYFYQGHKFTAVERRFFLNPGFRYPLDENTYKLTSLYGKRNDPFTGHPRFHNGIDLAAPMGSPVRASNAGVVSRTGYSDIFGNYILIKHDNGYETLYGHLSEISVNKDDILYGGQKIGQVGTTGRSTGPHLHFEVRKTGETLNPLQVIK